ncbi:hypothetical protein K456DRAFT_604404 [Colletotrichum gloeosporioides 23]|nr:hypothetical protein K456DRAFT_604404 [Colletotrichum gloeosporioides 23]
MAGNGSRTRDGCFHCRQRKKRCDKYKPECGKCQKDGVACVYPSLDPTSELKFTEPWSGPWRGQHPILPLKTAANNSFVNIARDELAVICQQYIENPVRQITAGRQRQQRSVLSLNELPLKPNPSWRPMSNTESKLVQYYFEVISNSKVYVDTESNIFKSSVMPVLLSNDGPLLSTVLALSAAEWDCRGAHDGVDYGNSAIRYKGMALSQLRSSIMAETNAEENVLTCVLQASLEISAGSGPDWLLHLRGALAIMENHPGCVSANCAALALQYFRFRYILMKTTENREPGRSEAKTKCPKSDQCGDAIEALNRISLKPESRQTVHPQTGCSTELVELIDLISLTATNEQQSKATSEDGPSLEKRIRELEFHATEDYLLKSAECFRLATLIYLHLKVYHAPIRFPSMSTLLQPLIDCLAEVIREDLPRRSFPMWPLFIAGCTSCIDEHRKAVLDMLNLLDDKWPISNISTVTEVMATIYNFRDLNDGLAATVQHDWQNIIGKFGWKLSLS